MSDEPVKESRYKPLKVPEFKSALPPHIASHLSESDRYLVDAVSRMEQKSAWLVDTAVQANEALQETDQRVDSLERWKSALMSKWALIAGVVMLCLPILLKALFDYIIRKHLQ